MNKINNYIDPFDPHQFLYHTCIFCNKNLIFRFKRKESILLYCKNCSPLSYSKINLCYCDMKLIEVDINFEKYFLNLNFRRSRIRIRDKDYFIITDIRDIVFEYKHDKDYLLNKIQSILVFS